MTPLRQYSFEAINSDSGSLLFEGHRINGSFVGRKLEAQFEVQGNHLVLLQADQTKIIAYLLGNEGKIIDQLVIGHWYFDSSVENIEIVSPNAIEFNFGSRGRLEVHVPPKRPGLFKTKRYLCAKGLPIEV